MLRYPTLMSRIDYAEINMEDSGKHRFHGLEHDSKMRVFTTFFHTSTLRGYEASGNMLPTAENLKQRTEDGEKGTEHFQQMARSTCARAITPQISEGNGGREKKGKRELDYLSMQKNRNNVKKMRKRWAGVEGGRVKNLAQGNPKRSQKRTRTRYYVRNPTRVRNGHCAPPSGGDVETGRRITKNPPPGKLNQNPQQKRMSLEEAKLKTGKTGSK